MLQQHLFEHGVLSLRELLRMVLLSSLFTVVCLKAFPQNAPTRRVLLLAGVAAVALLPWLLAGLDAIWYVALERVPPLTLSTLIPNVLLWSWLGVAVVLVVQHLQALAGEIHALCRLPRLHHERADFELSRLCAALDMPRPHLRLGDCACSTTLGKPVVVLPQNWLNWDDVTLRSVLAHELTHIQRRDDRWLLLTRVLVLSYWWMPWLIWLYRSYVRVMEESCDDAASELVGHQQAYAGALVDAAGVAQNRRTDNFSHVTNMVEHHLVGRIGRFADTRVLELDTSGVYWWVIGILLTVTGLTGVEPVLAPAQVPVVDFVQAVSAPRDADLPQQQAVYPRVAEHVQIPAGSSAAAGERIRQPRRAGSAVYPGAAIRRGIEGEVVVEFGVSADGNVTNARVLQSHPAEVFNASALHAVSNTRYRPAHTLPAHATARHSAPLRFRRHFRYRLDAR